MKSTCCRCVGHYDPSEDADANATFCGPCSRKLETLSRDARTYQEKINAGDPTVIPETPEDARKVRSAIHRRLTSEPDCQPLRRHNETHN